MVEFSKNKWKYSTIGLLAVLAIGFSFPQAFAHVTTSLAHNVQHIMDVLTSMQDTLDDIETNLDEGQYGQIIVVNKHAQAFIPTGSNDSSPFVTTIPEGQEGTLHRLDCLLLGTDPPGRSTDNSFDLRRANGDLEDVICAVDANLALNPGDILVYNCELIGGPATQNTKCDAEVTMWMTLKNT